MDLLVKDLYLLINEIKGCEQKSDIKINAKKTLKIVDGLLGKLPSGEVYQFSRSRKFRMYEKVVNDISNQG